MVMATSTSPANKTASANIEYSKSNFILHAFHAEITNETIMIQVVKMRDSLYLWIGNKRNPEFCDLSVAFNTSGIAPVSSKILGTVAEDASRNLASRLCKKLNKAVYVSLNLDANVFNSPLIEKRIQDEIVKFPDYF